MQRVLPFLCVALLAMDAGYCQSHFKRGDANGDEAGDISDAVATLTFLFSGGPESTCADAADTNDDGKVDISDPVALLSFLFSGGAAPKAPFPDCGPDPTDDDGQGCAAYAHCVVCYGQADLERSLAEGITPTVCIPADSVAPVAVGILTATVCPGSEAGPCPGTAVADPPGCAVGFTTIEGTLDVPAQTVIVHLEGQVDDLPIVIVNGLTGSTEICPLDIAFSGDVVVEFEAIRQDGQLVIQDILEPFLQDEVIEVTTGSTALLCTTLVALQDLFKANLVEQLQGASSELLADLRADLIGQAVCER
jgi:hypothetical protein